MEICGIASEFVAKLCPAEHKIQKACVWQLAAARVVWTLEVPWPNGEGRGEAMGQAAEPLERSDPTVGWHKA